VAAHLYLGGTYSTHEADVNPAIAPFQDLAPQIHRQRLVLEGYPANPIDDLAITTYLSQLSGLLGMITILEPVTHRSDQFGWAGWIHWETSGAHFYAWEEPLLFFSVDIYTCKAFDPELAALFTTDFFDADSLQSASF